MPPQLPLLIAQHWGHTSRTALPCIPCFCVFSPTQGHELLGVGGGLHIGHPLPLPYFLYYEWAHGELGAKRCCHPPWNVWIWLPIRFRAW